MAELSTAETTINACCAPETQASCCEPSAKAECCGDSHADGCGCDPGRAAAAPALDDGPALDDAPAGDIREQVRERYAAAATQVARTDAGSGCCAPSETFDGGSDVFGAALYALGDREQLPDTVAGALTEREFRAALIDAGLTEIEIRETHRVHDQAVSAIVRARKPD